MAHQALVLHAEKPAFAIMSNALISQNTYSSLETALVLHLDMGLMTSTQKHFTTK